MVILSATLQLERNRRGVFFLNVQFAKIKFNLSFINKINIIYDLLKNNYDEIYILTPKNFYFFLPFFFRKTKFLAIVYNSQNKFRPINFLRNYLYKYKIGDYSFLF